MLSGCSLGSEEEVSVIIIKAYTEKTNWGCIGTDFRTVIKTEDGRVDDICGWYGEVGDIFTGTWKKGHWDHVVNGFRPKT